MPYTYQGYKIDVSDRKDKKYMAYVGDRKVHFGDSNYQQYHDKLGHYKSLDHNDEKRRELYRARHGANNFHKIKGSASWFSWNILW